MVDNLQFQMNFKISNLKLKIVFLTILCVGLFGLAKNSHAADWYVDNSVPSSGNGLSWATAWKNFSDIVWGLSGVKAGDILYISGGSISQTYTATANSMLTIGASGTVGNPITIATGAKSPSPSGHDGVVIFDGNNTYTDLIMGRQNYIVIDGEKSGAINWKLHNTKRTDCSDRCVSLSDTTTYYGKKITYLEIYDVAKAIDAPGPGNVAGTFEISYCYIHGVVGETTLNVTGDDPTGLGRSLIHHNTFECILDMSGAEDGPDVIQVSRGADIYNNTFNAVSGVPIRPNCQHPDFIQSAPQSHRIYNNIFDGGNLAGALQVFAHANGTMTTQYLEFYNNVLTRVAGTGFANGITGEESVTITSATYIVSNNTCADSINPTGSGRCFDVALQGLNAPDDPVFIFENNILYNSGTTQPLFMRVKDSDQLSEIIVDYNDINAGAHGNAYMDWYDGSDHHFVQAHGQTGMPSFVSYSEYSASNNYHLASNDTVAINQGVNLSAYFTSDIGGISRPQGAAWDIGAYEYVSGGGDVTSPSVPSGLSVD